MNELKNQDQPQDSGKQERKMNLNELREAIRGLDISNKMEKIKIRDILIVSFAEFQSWADLDGNKGEKKPPRPEINLDDFTIRLKVTDILENGKNVDLEIQETISRLVDEVRAEFLQLKLSDLQALVKSGKINVIEKDPRTEDKIEIKILDISTDGKEVTVQAGEATKKVDSSLILND